MAGCLTVHPAVHLCTSRQVRAAAYVAIARYSLDSLERMEVRQHAQRPNRHDHPTRDAVPTCITELGVQLVWATPHLDHACI